MYTLYNSFMFPSSFIQFLVFSRHAIKSSPVLLGSIQNELSHLEGHIKHLQKELTEYVRWKLKYIYIF